MAGRKRRGEEKTKEIIKISMNGYGVLIELVNIKLEVDQ